MSIWSNLSRQEAIDEEPWRCSDVDAGGNPIPGQETDMTFRRMNRYAQRMKQAGIHVLNYFTTTEFGLAMKGIEQVDYDLSEDDLWKDCTSFAYRKIRDGVLPDQEGKQIYSNWGGAVVTDCGSTTLSPAGISYSRGKSKIPEAN